MDYTGYSKNYKSDFVGDQFMLTSYAATLTSCRRNDEAASESRNSAGHSSARDCSDDADKVGKEGKVDKSYNSTHAEYLNSEDRNISQGAKSENINSNQYDARQSLKSNEKNNPSHYEWKYIYRNACAVIIVALATISFYFTWYEFVRVNNQTGHLTGTGNLLMATIIYALLFSIIGKGMHAYKIGVERITNTVVSQVLTVLVVDIFEVFISMAITGQWRFVNEFIRDYAVLAVIQSVVLGFLVVPMIMIYKHLFPPIDVIEIYGQKNGLYERISKLEDKYNVSELIYSSDYDFEEIVEKIGNHEAVLINDLPSKQKNLILKTCFEMNKRVYVVPKISDIIMKNSEELNVIDTPFFLCRNREISTLQRALKRCMDLMLSSIALVILSPIILITAIAIKAEDGGSVFFRQERVTEHGKVFTILKFRSMKEDSGDTLSPTTDDDDRITKVGKRIRPWRIDELPQLINIIRGDMSIVGPRPERVEHVEKYTELIPEFGFRQKMKSGLTGYAQVYGRYNTSALDKLKLDLIYITRYSLITDIQVIFETVKILMFKESTEGFHSSGVLDEENLEVGLEEARREFEVREK